MQNGIKPVAINFLERKQELKPLAKDGKIVQVWLFSEDPGAEDEFGE